MTDIDNACITFYIGRDSAEPVEANLRFVRIKSVDSSKGAMRLLNAQDHIAREQFCEPLGKNMTVVQSRHLQGKNYDAAGGYEIEPESEIGRVCLEIRKRNENAPPRAQQASELYDKQTREFVRQNADLLRQYFEKVNEEQGTYRGLIVRLPCEEFRQAGIEAVTGDKCVDKRSTTSGDLGLLINMLCRAGLHPMLSMAAEAMTQGPQEQRDAHANLQSAFRPEPLI